MKIYTVDTVGWAEAHDSAESIESSLEYIDISSNEYVVIDDAGFLYEWNENSNSHCGYEIKRTSNKDLLLLAKIQGNESNDPFKI